MYGAPKAVSACLFSRILTVAAPRRARKQAVPEQASRRRFRVSRVIVRGLLHNSGFFLLVIVFSSMLMLKAGAVRGPQVGQYLQSRQSSQVKKSIRARRALPDKDIAEA